MLPPAPARPRRSPRKLRSTGSTSCGPASPRPTFRPVMSCAPTRTSNRPNGRSEHRSGRMADRPIHHHRGPCSCARADLHARLLPHLGIRKPRGSRCCSHSTSTCLLQTDLLRKRALPRRDTERIRRSHTGVPRPAQHRTVLTQLPHPDPRHYPPARPRQHLREAHPAYRAASRSARPRRPRPRRGRSVDTTPTPQNPRKPC